MVLLVYKYDKNDSDTEQFLNVPVRLDLGFFPSKYTYIRLKQVGFYNEDLGGMVHLDFPDTLPEHISEEIIDESDVWETPGFIFSANYGENGRGGRGNYSSQSTHLDLNLPLGMMDTNKDFFTIVVNGRRGLDTGTTNQLNSIYIVLEMSHHNRHT